MKKNTSIGLVVVLGIFGYLFIPKIINRLAENQTITSNRSIKPGHTSLDFIRLNGEAKKVPDFLMLNQDSYIFLMKTTLGKYML